MTWPNPIASFFAKKEIPVRDPAKSDFCYYPFFQVLMTAGGKYMPCSKHEAFITHNGKVLTADNATIEDAWNSQTTCKTCAKGSTPENAKKAVKNVGESKRWAFAPCAMTRMATTYPRAK
jgi:hypothetical protein